MDNNNLKLQHSEVLVEAYQQWLLHPVTVLLKKNLLIHKQKAERFLLDRVSDTKTSDSEIRQQVHILKTTDHILNLLQSYEVFTRNLENKQST